MSSKRKKIKVGIVGATGYTGSELIRILIGHPDVSLEIVTSESKAGKEITDVHPQLRKMADIPLKSLSELQPEKLDVLFLALPHRVSMNFIAENTPLPCKVIDLSGDFRMNDVATYEKWYDVKHAVPDMVKTAAYGMPELFRDEILKADLIANPGCYPTTSILPLAPLVKDGLIEPNSVIVDAKSGITGAGAKAKDNTHFPNASDNFSAYGVKTHRHTPEIERTVLRFCNVDMSINFTPHLLPVNRGILATSYSQAKQGTNEKSVRDSLEKAYGDEYFIRLIDTPPEIRQVRGSNFCDIFATFDERTNRVITISVIDNLVKGAAGQAVQNMNLISGLPEASGLMTPPLSP